jgi:hypothetical protein
MIEHVRKVLSDIKRVDPEYEIGRRVSTAPPSTCRRRHLSKRFFRVVAQPLAQPRQREGEQRLDF